MKQKIKNKYFILLIVWFIVIFILSSISGNKLHKIDGFKIPHLDKFVHFIMYFTLQYLWLKFMLTSNIEAKKSFIITSSIISVTYGVFLEMMQSLFFIARSGDLYDAITNTIGVIFALLFYKILLINRQ